MAYAYDLRVLPDVCTMVVLGPFKKEALTGIPSIIVSTLEVQVEIRRARVSGSWCMLASRWEAVCKSSFRGLYPQARMDIAPFWVVDNNL